MCGLFFMPTKKPLLGKAEAATHYLNSTDSIALHLILPTK